MITIYASIDIITEKKAADQILCAIDVGDVSRDVPFLLSRSSLSRMGELIDFPPNKLI